MTGVQTCALPIFDALKDANTYAAQKQTAAAATYGHQLQAAVQRETNETVRKVGQENTKRDKYFKRKKEIEDQTDKELANNALPLSPPKDKSLYSRWKAIMDKHDANMSALNTSFGMNPATPSGGGAVDKDAIDAILRSRGVVR